MENSQFVQFVDQNFEETSQSLVNFYFVRQSRALTELGRRGRWMFTDWWREIAMKSKCSAGPTRSALWTMSFSGNSPIRSKGLQKGSQTNRCSFSEMSAHFSEKHRAQRNFISHWMVSVIFPSNTPFCGFLRSWENILVLSYLKN